MKPGKYLKVFSVLLTLTLLFMTMPLAALSAATASINLSTSQGTHGTTFSISGTADVSPILFYFSSQNVSTGTRIDVDITTYKYLGETGVDGGGNLTTFNSQVASMMDSGTVKLPVINGSYYVYATTSGTNKNVLAKASFTVTGVVLNASLSFDEGYVGEELEITGEGFQPGENIQVLFGDTDITSDYVDGSRVVGSTGASQGRFSITIPVPASSYGDKTIIVKGLTSGIEVDLDFKVLSKITLDPTKGEAGTPRVLVTGTGFARSNFVDIYFDNSLIIRTSIRTFSGSFTQTIDIPAGKTPGNYQVSARDASSPNTINASAIFKVEEPPLNPVITLEPLGEKVGDTVEISGTEFNNNKSITLTIGGTTVTPDSAITTTGTGTFTGSFSIPEMPAGTYTLKASDGTVHAEKTFTVVSNMTMSPTSGKAGTDITVTGTGYRANANITVRFGGTPVAFDTIPRTDSKGSFNFKFSVPAVAPGAHVVEVAIGTATETRSFTTSYEFDIAPLSGKTGTQVEITGNGFAANQAVTITFGGIQLPVTTTNAQGVLNHQFNIPHVADGDHTVEVRIGTIIETRSFTTQSQVNFSPANGPVGTQVSVSGTGFGPNKPLTLTFDGSAVPGSTGLTVNTEGAFNIAFAVPTIQAGSYTISISDGTITKTSSFAVSASTPPTPQLAAPAMGTKLEGPVTFDWQPVNYTVMDITYELQVSRSSNFATLVLDKKDLTATEYTTIQAEQLEKATAEEPYYWRVRVVDEAGNTSAWSGAAQFAYGSSWPVWLTWVLISLGVIVLGILAFWLGRRIAYYSY